MTVRFKTPYVGARRIQNLHTYTYNDNFVYFGKLFEKIDAHFVDEDGVVWVENTDGFLVEKTL